MMNDITIQISVCLLYMWKKVLNCFFYTHETIYELFYWDSAENQNKSPMTTRVYSSWFHFYYFTILLDICISSSVIVEMPTNKSNRPWKSERDRFRSVIKTKGLKHSLKQKNRLKEDKVRAKLLEKSLKDATLKQKEDLRARQEENKKRREENEKKSEVYQEVSKHSISGYPYSQPIRLSSIHF